MTNTSGATEQFDKCTKKRVAGVSHSFQSYKKDNIPCKIDEGLYLGSIAAAANKVALKNYNITNILTVAGRIPPAHPGDFVYKIINVVDRDDEDLKQYFSECFDFINEAKRHGGSVLVHCYAGRSRRIGPNIVTPSSVTIVVAYLMKTRGMSFFEALKHVRSIRPVACPNSGFSSQLKNFQESLQETPTSTSDSPHAFLVLANAAFLLIACIAWKFFIMLISS